MTDDEKVKALTASNAIMVAAQNRHRAYVKELFPVGCYVRWKEGPYIKAGTVQGHSLTGCNLRVNGKTVLIEAVVNAVESDA